MKNPKLYHGCHNVGAVFVAKTGRDMRNWESIGTFLTTDKDHARNFGKYIYSVETPDVLRFYKPADNNDLTLPFIEPALGPAYIGLSQGEKKLLKAAFVAAPVENSFYGMRSYEKVVKLYDKSLRRLGDDTAERFRWLRDHAKEQKYADKCRDALRTAEDISRNKLFHNAGYADFLWDWYTSRGFDGIAWENTIIDRFETDTPHSQYLIFHPEKYPFTSAS